MIVLDTSSLVEFLVGTDEPADAVRAVTAGERIAAPHAVDLECASALRGLTRGGKLASDESLRALLLLGRMNLRRYEHAPLLPRIWELRHNMWPYDACYVALAESLNATLVTIDRKFGRVPGIRCTINYLHEGS